MKRRKRHRAGVALAAALMLAGSLRAAPEATDDQVLLSATSAYEDIADRALAGDDAGVAKALAAADRQADSVASVLPREAAARFRERLKAVHVAASHDDAQGVAMAAVEAYGLLLSELDPSRLDVPREVSLLDYAGFRLQVLASAREPDWETMESVAAQASTWWKALESQMTDAALEDAFSTTIAGIQEAVGSANLPMLRLAAQMDLDLVDLIEHHFAARSRTSAASRRRTP